MFANLWMYKDHLVLVFDHDSVEPGEHVALGVLERFLRLVRGETPGVHLQQDCEALSEFPLQVLDPSQALELSVHHDSQPVTEGLAFFHATGINKKVRIVSY